MPRMGWMQLRRWLSFLPAAFVLYILLHYLVYQPNLQETHSSYPGSSRLMKLALNEVNPSERQLNSENLIPYQKDDMLAIVSGTNRASPRRAEASIDKAIKEQYNTTYLSSKHSSHKSYHQANPSIIANNQNLEVIPAPEHNIQEQNMQQSGKGNRFLFANSGALNHQIIKDSSKIESQVQIQSFNEAITQDEIGRDSGPNAFIIPPSKIISVDSLPPGIQLLPETNSRVEQNSLLPEFRSQETNSAAESNLLQTGILIQKSNSPEETSSSLAGSPPQVMLSPWEPNLLNSGDPLRDMNSPQVANLLPSQDIISAWEPRLGKPSHDTKSPEEPSSHLSEALLSVRDMNSHWEPISLPSDGMPQDVNSLSATNSQLSGGSSRDMNSPWEQDELPRRIPLENANLHRESSSRMISPGEPVSGGISIDANSPKELNLVSSGGPSRDMNSPWELNPSSNYHQFQDHESIIIPRELLSKQEKSFKRKEENVGNVSANTPVKSKVKTHRGNVPVSQEPTTITRENVKEDAKSKLSVDNHQSAKTTGDSKSVSKSVSQNVSSKIESKAKAPLKLSTSTKVLKAKGSAIHSRQAVVKPASKHAINSLKGKFTINDMYEKGFTTPHEEICINNGRELRVLILVTTAPNHEKHRNAVRQTWGHFAMRKDVALAFVVGRTSRTDVQTVIDKENDRYGDIIEANFVDRYSNLTLKTVSMFEWARTYCSEASFVLKTDDDMFINVPLLLAFISAKKNEKRVMFGRLAKGWKPIRNSKSKYYIPKETYSLARYPDFVTGPAYLFTSDIVESIYQKALTTNFFILEDVFLTGFVGESLGIRRVGDSHFRNEKIPLKDTCKLMQSISIHMVKYEEQFDIYKRTLDGKTKCKTR